MFPVVWLLAQRDTKPGTDTNDEDAQQSQHPERHNKVCTLPYLSMRTAVLVDNDTQTEQVHTEADNLHPVCLVVVIVADSETPLCDRLVLEESTSNERCD